MSEPLQIAFLGCGYITGVHSKILRSLPDLIRCAYASRDAAKAAAYCKKYGGSASYSDYSSAIDDPRVDAVVVAVPPQFHLELTLAALAAGKHVLVEKPAFMCMADYERRWRRERGAPRRARGRERSLQAAGRVPPPAA